MFQLRVLLQNNYTILPTFPFLAFAKLSHVKNRAEY